MLFSIIPSLFAWSLRLRLLFRDILTVPARFCGLTFQPFREAATGTNRHALTEGQPIKRLAIHFPVGTYKEVVPVNFDSTELFEPRLPRARLEGPVRISFQILPVRPAFLEIHEIDIECTNFDQLGPKTPQIDLEIAPKMT